MTVATFTAPNFTTQLGNSYKGNIDGGMSVFARIAGAFAPHEQSTPNLTVRLDAGYVFSGSILTEVAAQSSAAITAPTTNPRIDRLVVDAGTGAVSVVTGVQGAAPVAPAIPAGKLPVARVLLQTTSTVITNSMLTDERTLQSTSPPAIANFAAGTAVYVDIEGDIDSSVLSHIYFSPDVSTSVGKTGSGASVIWSALDAVPNTAKALLVRGVISVSGSAAGGVSAALYTSAAAFSPAPKNRIVYVGGYDDPANLSNQSKDISAIIPITALGTFNLYWSRSSGGTPTSTWILYLLGWV